MPGTSPGMTANLIEALFTLPWRALEGEGKNR
jgi:hypothetical protein